MKAHNNTQEVRPMLKLGDFDVFYNMDKFSWYDEDEVVATVEISKEKGVKWISGVYVSPEYRGNGLSIDLMRFAIIMGGKKLSVRKSNLVAMRLYENMGFSVFDEDDRMFYMRLEERIGND